MVTVLQFIAWFAYFLAVEEGFEACFGVFCFVPWPAFGFKVFGEVCMFRLYCAPTWCSMGLQAYLNFLVASPLLFFAPLVFISRTCDGSRTLRCIVQIRTHHTPKPQNTFHPKLTPCSHIRAGHLERGGTTKHLYYIIISNQ